MQSDQGRGRQRYSSLTKVKRAWNRTERQSKVTSTKPDNVLVPDVRDGVHGTLEFHAEGNDHYVPLVKYPPILGVNFHRGEQLAIQDGAPHREGHRIFRVERAETDHVGEAPVDWLGVALRGLGDFHIDVGMVNTG